MAKKPSSKSGGGMLHLALPEKSAERLDRLRERTEASSVVEVVRKALKLYEYFINEAEAGKEILIKDADGNVKLLFIYFARS